MRLLLDRDELAEAVSRALTSSAPDTGVERLELRPVHRGFPEFVNAGTIDVSEIAVVTLLQAVSQGRPIGLLPITVLGRFQHHTLVTCGDLTVDQISGRSVGVRSWTQTTGVWVRGALAEQFGIDLRTIDWVTYEDGHLEGHPDPSWVRRAAPGSQLANDLIEGRVDFAIIGNDLPAGTPVRTAIPEPEASAREWYRATGCVPINHVVGVSLAAAREHPAAICAIYDELQKAVAGGRCEYGVQTTLTGFAAMCKSFTLAAAYAGAQEVLPRQVSFEGIVHSTCDALGVPPSRLGG
jgi:4,5-dihydroxyphthalate decarboxylase